MASGLGSAKITAFIATTDRVAAKAFYSDTLGLRFVEETPFAVVFDAGGTTLRVTPVSQHSPAGYTVLGWNVADIETAVDGLNASGVLFERFPGMDQDERGIWTAPGGAKVAWFKDPDGNVLSVSAS